MRRLYSDSTFTTAMKPTHCVTLLLPVLIAAATLAQTPAAPIPAATAPATEAASLPTDPTALLQMAADANGLHAPTLKPWHIRATWQVLDEKKHAKTQGAWEEWWAADQQYKIVAVSGSDRETIYGTNHGAFVVTAGQNSLDSEDLSATPDAISFTDFAALPYGADGAAFLFQRLLTQPVPEATATALAHMRLQESRETDKGPDLVCILQAFLLPDGTPHVTRGKDGQFHPTIGRYCFDSDHPALRLESTPAEVILFNSLVRFQDRYVPRSIRILHTQLQTFSSHDDTLSRTTRSLTPAQEADVNLDVIEPLQDVRDADFVPPPQANPLPQLRETALTEGLVAGEMIAGDLGGYPAEAREWHIQGNVVVEATIGRNGVPGDVHAVSGPDALRQAAVESLRKQRYEPFLVGGQPVNVRMRLESTYTYN